MVHKYYIAQKADSNYHSNAKTSRQGVRSSDDKLSQINELITPLIKQGQSINHIFSTHANDINLCEKTIYNYIDIGVLNIKNIDLPKKVAYRKRRNKSKKHNAEALCRKGRTIKDFEKFVKQTNPRFIVEMDTVKGNRGSHKTLLTMIFRKTSFMMIFLMPDGTQESVQDVFDQLTRVLGLQLFSLLFNTILTDNGPEFKNPESLEFTANGLHRCNIFYCDPLASWQKPHVENNHKLIRRILPKGTSFDNLTQSDITLVANHINSVAREIYGNKTPFEMLNKWYFKKPLERLCLEPVPPDSINLTPKLLKK
jgi:IS30 family transposase